MKAIFVLSLLSLFFILQVQAVQLRQRRQIEREGEPTRVSDGTEKDEEEPYSEKESEKEGDKEPEKEEDDDEPGNILIVHPFNRPNLPSPFNIFQLFRPAAPWWKGPNVCIERKVIEEPAENANSTNADSDVDSTIAVLRISSCKVTSTAYICRTKVVSPKESTTTEIIHKCCHGYKLSEKDNECVLFDIKDIHETLKETGASKLDEMLSQSEIKEVIMKENVTIFSPTDEAIMEFEGDFNKNENEIPVISSEPSKTGIDVSRVVVEHTVRGLYSSHDFHDNLIIPTIDNRSTIRINTFYTPERIVTANCAPIEGHEVYATNAIIHMVNKILPTPRHNLLEALERDGRFSTFLKLIRESGLQSRLEDKEEHLTLIAPTDEAFNQMSPLILAKLKTADSCLNRDGNLVKNHLISRIICSSALPSSVFLSSVAGSRIRMERNSEGHLLFNGIPVKEKDMMTTNGVMYAIEGVLIPENVKSFAEGAESLSNKFEDSMGKYTVNDFIKYANESGLLSELESAKNATFFIPNDRAFSSMSEAEKKDFMENIQDYIRYTVSKPSVSSSHFYNNRLLESSTGQKVRLNVDLGFLNSITKAQCSPVVLMNKEICDGVIHVVDRVMKPPKSNIMEIIKSMEGFTLFRNMLENSTYGKKLREDSGPFTVLLPSDESLSQELEETELEAMVADEAKLNKFLQRYILPEMVCCSSMRLDNPSLSLFFELRFRTMNNSFISTRLNNKEQIEVAFHSTRRRATLSQCDLTAENGAVHVIESLPSKPVTFVNLGPQLGIFK